MAVDKPNNFLVGEIKVILQKARQQATNAVNSAMVFAYWVKE